MRDYLFISAWGCHIRKCERAWKLSNRTVHRKSAKKKCMFDGIKSKQIISCVARTVLNWESATRLKFYLEFLKALVCYFILTTYYVSLGWQKKCAFTWWQQHVWQHIKRCPLVVVLVTVCYLTFWYCCFHNLNTSDTCKNLSEGFYSDSSKMMNQ